MAPPGAQAGDPALAAVCRFTRGPTSRSIGLDNGEFIALVLLGTLGMMVIASGEHGPLHLGLELLSPVDVRTGRASSAMTVSRLKRR